MNTRRIGPFTVSAIGLGCMNLSHAYGTPPPPEDAEKLLLAALDAGVSLFDTAALYGFGVNEELVGRVLGPHRSKFTLASKGGLGGVKGDDGVVRRVIDGRPDSVRRNCEDSLQRLKTDTIDLYYLHRWDKKVPIEETAGALADLVKAGKVRSVGLSEVSVDTLKRAHAVQPITAVQNEYSLWSRNAEIAMLGACREMGVAFVPFSPLARGFLTGKLREVASLGEKDIRRNMPRFEPANYAANVALLAGYEQIARDAGCTPAQLALAWLLARGDNVVPIPGTRSIAHLQENLGAADVTLSPDVMARLDSLINERTVTGARYNAQNAAEVDAENFAA